MKFIINIEEPNLEQLKLEALRLKVKSRKELAEKIINDYTDKLELKIIGTETDMIGKIARQKILIELEPEIASQLTIEGAKQGVVRKKFCEKIINDFMSKLKITKD